MTYSYEVSKALAELLEKIKKKNPRQFEAIIKKMRQILENPLHYKPLRGGMKGLRRFTLTALSCWFSKLLRAKTRLYFGISTTTTISIRKG